MSTPLQVDLGEISGGVSIDITTRPGLTGVEIEPNLKPERWDVLGRRFPKVDPNFFAAGAGGEVSCRFDEVEGTRSLGLTTAYVRVPPGSHVSMTCRPMSSVSMKGVDATVTMHPETELRVRDGRVQLTFLGPDGETRDTFDFDAQAYTTFEWETREQMLGLVMNQPFARDSGAGGLVHFISE